MNETFSSPSDVSSQVEALHRQLFILLLALIVVSGTLATYLWYQSRVAKQVVDGIRPQAMLVIQNYKQVTSTMNIQQMSMFVNQINAFAITHPDYAQQVLKKYGITPVPPNTAPPVKK